MSNYANKNKYSLVLCNSDGRNRRILKTFFFSFFPPVEINSQNSQNWEYIYAPKKPTVGNKCVPFSLVTLKFVLNVHCNKMLTLLLKLCNRTLSTNFLESFSVNTN